MSRTSPDREVPLARSSPVFARHESFHPRHGWLKKGFDAALTDSSIFTRDEAAIVLGVGKNMVRSIRYWCYAFKILEAGPDGSVPTQFGHELLGNSGWDPYLEDVGSLWILHERLLSSPFLATAWQYAFLIWPRPELTGDELARGLQDYVQRVYPATRSAASSIRKDVSCLLRMYAHDGKPWRSGEESIRCPFVELGLIGPAAASGAFGFAYGDKAGLTPEIITSAALRLAGRTAPQARTVSLARLLADQTGPSAMFKLTESGLYSALEQAANRHRGLDLTEAGGIIQLSYENASRQADLLLNYHFRSTTARGAA